MRSLRSAELAGGRCLISMFVALFHRLALRVPMPAPRPVVGGLAAVPPQPAPERIPPARQRPRIERAPALDPALPSSRALTEKESPMFRSRSSSMPWAALGALLLAFAGAASGAATHEVTDLAGRKVQVPVQIERVMLGEGRLLPALALIERGDPTRRLVAMMGEFELLDPAGYAQWRARFPALDRVQRIGRSSAGSVSVEQVIAARPQLAIFGLGGGHGPSDRDRETIARLEAVGTAVVFIDFRHDPLRNATRSIRLLGEIFGERERAASFIADYDAALARVTTRLAAAKPPAPSVFLENRVGLSEGCCDTMVGLVGLLLDAAGGSNIARGLVPGEYGTLNPEFLIARQPDVYIGTGIGAEATADKHPLRIVLGAGASETAARASLQRAVQRRGVAQLAAVKNGRAYAIWHHFYNSPFNVAAVQAMAKWLHPALFADLDPRATLADFYARYQPIPLDGVYWVALDPAAPAGGAR